MRHCGQGSSKPISVRFLRLAKLESNETASVGGAAAGDVEHRARAERGFAAREPTDQSGLHVPNRSIGILERI
jgi:hypothetical protein